MLHILIHQNVFHKGLSTHGSRTLVSGVGSSSAGSQNAIKASAPRQHTVAVSPGRELGQAGKRKDAQDGLGLKAASAWIPRPHPHTPVCLILVTALAPVCLPSHTSFLNSMPDTPPSDMDKQL
jgi:hypothetical protein